MIQALGLALIKQASASTLQVDSSSAAILAYNRIGEDNFLQTSLREQDFKTHIEEIISNNYNVVPLPELITSLKNGQHLPDKTIAITFEGAYKSAFIKAMPLLLEADIPFTIFYASSNASVESGEYMSWNDLKSLRRNKNVSFGILPSSYLRVIENNDEDNKRYLNNAKIAFRENFGQEAKLFSYPFGQHNKTYKEILRQNGIKTAFGLQSGVAYAGMNFLNIPRFTMTEGFGDIQRFRMVTSALPIPTEDIEPENRELKTKTPLFGFSVPEGNAFLLNSISCFISGHGRAETLKVGKNRLEIRPPHILDEGRVRINCTTNSGTVDEPKWRWFGMLYTVTPTE